MTHSPCVLPSCASVPVHNPPLRSRTPTERTVPQSLPPPPRRPGAVQRCGRGHRAAMHAAVLGAHARAVAQLQVGADPQGAGGRAVPHGASGRFPCCTEAGRMSMLGRRMCAYRRGVFGAMNSGCQDGRRGARLRRWSFRAHADSVGASMNVWRLGVGPGLHVTTLPPSPHPARPPSPNFLTPSLVGSLHERLRTLQGVPRLPA